MHIAMGMPTQQKKTQGSKSNSPGALQAKNSSVDSQVLDSETCTESSFVAVLMCSVSDHINVYI